MYIVRKVWVGEWYYVWYSIELVHLKVFMKFCSIFYTDFEHFFIQYSIFLFHIWRVYPVKYNLHMHTLMNYVRSHNTEVRLIIAVIWLVDQYTVFNISVFVGEVFVFVPDYINLANVSYVCTVSHISQVCFILCKQSNHVLNCFHTITCRGGVSYKCLAETFKWSRMVSRTCCLVYTHSSLNLLFIDFFYFIGLDLDSEALELSPNSTIFTQTIIYF